MQLAYELAVFIQALDRLIRWLYLQLRGREPKRPGGVLGFIINLLMLAADTLASVGPVGLVAIA